MKKRVILSLIVILVSFGLFAEDFGKVALTGVSLQGVPQNIQENFLRDLGKTFELHTSTKITSVTREADYVVSGALLGYKPGVPQCRYNFKIVDQKGTQLATAGGAMYPSELEDGGFALKLIQKFGPVMNAHYSDSEKTEEEWIAILNVAQTPTPVVVSIPKETPAPVKPEKVNTVVTDVPERLKFYSDIEIKAVDLLKRVDEILNAEVPDLGNIKVKIDFYNAQTEKWLAVVSDINRFVKYYGVIIVYDYKDVKYSFVGNGERITLDFTPGIKVIQNKVVVDTTRAFYEKWNAFKSNSIYADMKDGIRTIENKFSMTDWFYYYTTVSVIDSAGYPVLIDYGKQSKIFSQEVKPAKNYELIKRMSKYYEEGKTYVEGVTIKKDDLPDDFAINFVKFSDMYVKDNSKEITVMPVLTKEEWDNLVLIFEK